MGFYFAFHSEFGVGIIRAPIWSAFSAIIIGFAYCIFTFMYTVRQNPLSAIGLTICSGLNLISIIMDCLINDKFKVALLVYFILFYISYRAIDTLRQLEKITSLEKSKTLSK